MLRRTATFVVLAAWALFELGIVAFGLGIAGSRTAAAADCGLGLGFVPATLSASPPRIEAGDMTILRVDVGSPVWFECDSGTSSASRIYNQRVVGINMVQLYSGDGQFAHLAYPSGTRIETFFTYFNEGRFEVGGVGSAPIISGDPSMTVIGTAKVLFDQKLTHLPGGQAETYKDRSVSILVFARPTTVTVLPDSDM